MLTPVFVTVRVSAQVLGFRSKTGVFIPLALLSQAWKVERPTKSFPLGDWTVSNEYYPHFFFPPDLINPAS